jgi:hypothetical protein
MPGLTDASNGMSISGAGGFQQRLGSGESDLGGYDWETVRNSDGMGKKAAFDNLCR